MRFSKRTDWDITQNPLTTLLKAKKKEGERVIDLTQSNPTHCNFKYLDKNILDPFKKETNLTYEANPRGIIEARQVIQSYYAKKGIGVELDQIFLTASTSEAYAFLFRLLANPNERILVPRPSYPLFYYLTQLNDVEAYSYDFLYDTRWEIDGSLGKLKEDFKAIVLVNPNNPTGNFIQAHEKELVNNLCRSKNAAVISDEVFLDFSLKPDQKCASFAGNESSLTFTLSGISKVLGLPQMKLSWIVVSGPEDLKQQAMERLEVIADTFLSVNLPSQYALGLWFQLQPAIHAEISNRISSNHSFLRSLFHRHPRVKALEAEGGWYGVLKVESKKTDEELAVSLLEKDDLFVHPGYFFDFPEGSYIILSLLTEQKEFESGAQRLYEVFS